MIIIYGHSRSVYNCSLNGLISLKFNFLIVLLFIRNALCFVVNIHRIMNARGHTIRQPACFPASASLLFCSSSACYRFPVRFPSYRRVLHAICTLRDTFCAMLATRRERHRVIMGRSLVLCSRFYQLSWLTQRATAITFFALCSSTESSSTRSLTIKEQEG